MGRLISSGIVSADGYIVDADGSFAWAAPDPEVHAFVNDLQRDIRTHVFGRRMYEVMRFWEDVPGLAHEPAEMRDFAALWSDTDKVVVSTTLTPPDIVTQRTRLVSAWSPTLVTELLERGDVAIGGPTLTGAAWRDGLVDEVQLVVVPYLAGGGTPFFAAGVAGPLRTLESRMFRGGAVFTRYSTRG